jgi:hypothetical protein
MIVTDSAPEPKHLHEPTPEAKKYLDNGTAIQKKLDALAIQMLGSSYFVERTRGFEEYVKSQKK